LRMEGCTRDHRGCWNFHIGRSGNGLSECAHSTLSRSPAFQAQFRSLGSRQHCASVSTRGIPNTGLCRQQTSLPT
jgi:hypothetical protein